MPPRIEGLEGHLVSVGVRMVEERGWGEVSVRQVADAAGVSYGAPVARFGDETGLLAAVAERGFRLLEQELARPLDLSTIPQPSAPAAVHALGLRYVEFALTRRNLHRAMHHPDLRTAPVTRTTASPSIARRDARSLERRRRAEAARNACFARFVSAVVEDQMAGRVTAGPPGEIARLVAALAEGFILQEPDAPDAPPGATRQLGVAARLFQWIERGIARPA